jgi:uncharacterized repeat protein (TIGR02543 family)
MKKVFILSIVLIMLFSVVLSGNSVSAEELSYVNIYDWEVLDLVDSTGNSQWVKEDGGRTVEQRINGQPTFLINKKYNIINEVIKGTISVDSGGDNDDDFIGFVLGYSKNTDGTYNLIIFDWKRLGQTVGSNRVANEGYRLIKYKNIDLDNEINNQTKFEEYFWGKENVVVSEEIKKEVLAENYNYNGWNFDKEYFFEILYADNNIRVRVDGEEIFDVAGSFSAGNFGFYNYSQMLVTYGKVKSAQGTSNSASPVAADDYYGTTKNTPITATKESGILNNDYDPNLDEYWAVLESDVSNGTLDLTTSSGIFTYTPSTTFTGIDSFKYKLEDSQGDVSGTATVKISVFSEGNVAPSGINLSSNEVNINNTYTVGTLSTNDDNNDEGDVHDYILTNNAENRFVIENGVLKINENQISSIVSNSYTIRVRSTDLGGEYIEKDFTINANANFNIEYYQQNVNQTGYDLVSNDSQTLEGYVGESVTIPSKTYQGFSENINHVDRIESGNIAKDGSLTLKRYYDRNEYTVTFKDHDDSLLSTESVVYCDSLTLPTGLTKIGYTFTGWNTASDGSGEGYDGGESITIGASNMTLYAQWTANTYNVTYDGNGKDSGSVPIDGTSYNYGDTVTVLGNTGSLGKTGYTYDGWNTASNGSGTKYSGSNTFAMGTSDITLYAMWNANTDTPYKVKHYKEELDGTYTLADTDNLTGTTNTTATATAKIYTGFSENTSHTNRVESGIIAGDGSLVLELYYDREEYTVTFNDYDNSYIDTQTVKYEGTASIEDPIRIGYTFTEWDKAITNITENLTTSAIYTINQYTISFDTDGGSTVEDISQDYGTDITAPENPTKPGYSFEGWNPSLPSTMPAENKTISAQWLKDGDTAYTVEHYQQNVNDDGYTLKDTELKGGETESTASASALTYDGFYFDEDNTSNKTSGEILGDGSLVLQLYYNREVYTVTFLNHEDEVLKTETVRYQGSATPPPRPSRTGYDFRRWSEGYTYVTSDILTKATYRKEEPEPVVQESTVVVNGEEQTSGTETSLEVDGEMTATYSGDSQKIEEKIEEVIQDKEENKEENSEQNTLEIPIQTTNPDRVTSKLTGDIVKKLEDNDFNINIKTEIGDYELPAEEITITNVAKKLGVEETSLEKIEVDVEINKASGSEERQAVVRGREEGYRVLVTPVEFKVKAKTTSTTGEEKEVEIKEFKKYVKRRIPLPEDIDPNKITTAVLIEEDGSTVHIPTEVYQINGRWYAEINSLTNSKYTLINNEKTVKNAENHWSKEAVDDLASRKVIEDIDYFIPGVDISRGEFAEYITKALGIYRDNISGVISFKDLEKVDELYAGVQTASKYGIVKGYKDGTFRIKDKITREEAMIMYARAMKIADLKDLDLERIKNYKDSEEISDWAYEEVVETVGAGIFDGKREDTLDPKGTLTKAEAATALRNLLIKAGLINE